ncbi:DUF1853 family protein [Coraliomargarita algicola]|uniref:DUF1853 family protein n=1 Tax=Coraliomargarita algicola TaxID=3092156 RepID=A0ABZ0RGI4_9BACT|nr:DUF1853 family protein [Coraliomargarita sp. J2-16]WPJ94326.1 DUF1853 family protein [Coraliomargarita sp. J2-16]
MIATTPTQLILESLRSAPLLIGDLPEAAVLDRSRLGSTGACAVDPLRFDQKLGHLYEQALGRLLESSNALTLLASHLQVFAESGRTLGELDYLLHDHTRDQYIHLELAVKFYLAVKGRDGWQFPGPDPRDNWQRKLDRLRRHQLQLSRLPETRQLLCERFGIDAIQTQQLIYGCLFLPMGQDAVPPLELFSPSARVGHWLYLSEWAQNFAGVEEVLLMDKPLWPVELSSQAKRQFPVISVPRLHQLASERCTLFCLPDSTQPYFLVPPSWPGGMS